jgi:hypothetical protein
VGTPQRNRGLAADDCIGISVLDCLQCDGTGTVRLDPGRGNRPTRSGR